MIDGVYSGKILGIPALGEGKLIKVREWMLNNNLDDFKNATFYSDSMNDFPLLLAVNKPIAVNPDNKLREECKKGLGKLSIYLNWNLFCLQQFVLFAHLTSSQDDHGLHGNKLLSFYFLL